RAVPRTYATVIDHHIQAFRRVNGRAHRAHLFTTCRLAVLAQHRLEESLRCMQIALEVRIDADPLHDAADLHLLAAHNRNIVLRVATHNAGIAAHAGV